MAMTGPYARHGVPSHQVDGWSIGGAYMVGRGAGAILNTASLAANQPLPGMVTPLEDYAFDPAP